MGLDASAVYDGRAKTLTVTDNDSGETATLRGVISGLPRSNEDESAGPAPKGEYKIGEVYSKGKGKGENRWFKLYGKIEGGDWDYNKSYKQKETTLSDLLHRIINKYSLEFRGEFKALPANLWVIFSDGKAKRGKIG